MSLAVEEVQRFHEKPNSLFLGRWIDDHRFRPESELFCQSPVKLGTLGSSKKPRGYLIGQPVELRLNIYERREGASKVLNVVVNIFSDNKKLIWNKPDT